MPRPSIFAVAMSIIAFAARPAVTQERFEATIEPDWETIFGEYDCAVSADTETRHVGQWLQGSYQEWLESYSGDASGFRTRCVTQVVPAKGALSKVEAIILIRASAGLSIDERERSRAISPNAGRVVQSPRRVQPIPLGRVAPSDENDARGGRERNKVGSTRVVPGSPHVPSAVEPLVGGAGTPTMGQSPDPGAAPAAALPSLELRGIQPKPQPAPNANKDSRDEHDVEPHFQDGEKSESDSRLEREGTRVDAVDDRERITNTSSFPWNVVSILYIEFPDGGEGQCTGTLISPYAALTAGHCVHARDQGGLVTSVSAAPGQRQDQFFGPVVQPFGERFARYAATTERWKSVSGGETHPIRDYQYDYAAVFFEQPWTFTQTFMPVVYDDTRAPVNSAGYPGTVDNTPNYYGMWHDFGSETTNSILFWRDQQLREFALDASPGNSGGPFWLFFSSSNTSFLTGVLSYGQNDAEIAGGPWMGGDNEVTVRSWVTWTPDTILPPQQPQKEGLRLTALASSLISDYESYLRIYNASADTGSVTVTLSDAESGETLGNWTSANIPPRASRQYAIKDIENQMAPALQTIPIFYAAAITSEFDGYLQHVAWNAEGASLTNLSGCGNGLSDDVTTIMNFHSSNLAGGYDSAMYFHNVGNQTAEATIDIYDAANGEYIGGFLWREVPADATFVLFSEDVDFYLNDFFGYQPTASQNHYNIELNGDFPGYLQHAIDNSGAGVLTAMTAKCRLTAQ